MSKKYRKPPSSVILEPPSEANQYYDDSLPQYPFNNSTKTESGHSIEFDDTPGRERVRLQHRIGTFTEMQSDGTEVHKIVGDGYEIVVKDKNVKVSGDCTVFVQGNCNLTVQGDVNEYIKGDFNQVIEGDYNQLVKGRAEILSQKSMKIAAAPDTGSGSLHLMSSNHVYVDSDVYVGGLLTADAIVSKTRVDAGTGVSAGILGFTSALGGLTVGLPTPAVPGVVLCHYVEASMAVHSPLGAFGLMNATILMRDLINESVYNSHIHISPKGPTSPPVLRML